MCFQRGTIASSLVHVFNRYTWHCGHETQFDYIPLHFVLVHVHCPITSFEHFAKLIFYKFVKGAGKGQVT